MALLFEVLHWNGIQAVQWTEPGKCHLNMMQCKAKEWGIFRHGGKYNWALYTRSLNVFQLGPTDAHKPWSKVLGKRVDVFCILPFFLADLAVGTSGIFQLAGSQVGKWVLHLLTLLISEEFLTSNITFRFTMAPIMEGYRKICVTWSHIAVCLHL